MVPNKYDTNPLDPEFPERVRAEAADSGEQSTQVLAQAGAPTTQFGSPAPTEEQTRRFSEGVPFTSPYNGQYVPMAYENPYVAPARSDRKVTGIPLPEHVLIAAPYIPWYLGLIAGALILLLVPRSETKVRFHAAQGLAAHIGILIVTTILGIVGNVTDLAQLGNFIFQIVTTIMLIIFAVKAWKGKPVHIQAVDELTNWLEEKISPRLAGA